MATKDGFARDHAFPLFLAEEAEQPGIRKAWDGAVISSRILKTGTLLVTAVAIDVAILSVGNPVALFANVKASLVDISALPPGTGQSRPAIQSTAGAQALPPTARDAPARDEMTAALEPADQGQTEIRQPSAETLLNQFQAWAAEQATRDDITGALQPADRSVSDLRHTAVIPGRLQSERTRNLAVGDREFFVPPSRDSGQSAMRSQTEIGQPSAEALLKQFQAWAAEQDARAQIASVQDAGAQDRSVQNAEAPLPLRSIGWLD